MGWFFASKCVKRVSLAWTACRQFLGQNSCRRLLPIVAWAHIFGGWTLHPEKFFFNLRIFIFSKLPYSNYCLGLLIIMFQTPHESESGSNCIHCWLVLWFWEELLHRAWPSQILLNLFGVCQLQTNPWAFLKIFIKLKNCGLQLQSIFRSWAVLSTPFLHGNRRANSRIENIRQKSQIHQG